MRRKLAAVFLVVFSLLLMPMTAFAQTIDFDRKGSISVTLIDQNGKKPITGVELSLYYVANVSLS